MRAGGVLGGVKIVLRIMLNVLRIFGFARGKIVQQGATKGCCSLAPEGMWVFAWCGVGRRARSFAADKPTLVLVARNTPALEKLAAELRSQYGITVHVLTADLWANAGISIVTIFGIWACRFCSAGNWVCSWG